ncbi:hypothetical protein FF38_11753 [Lucilia cuprina]|uniref:Uncharacterized protein n=1 Tax=Lucilia cuprina TaxID=7375 RepID=A0A0L0CET7_LUCCU|nr:Phosphatidylethanolamine-binding protein like protein F40A3.3 [Lucilia cuprina]KNC30732.1 hypothetical protein FF38_11753 [Lucilia cuprina]
MDTGGIIPDIIDSKPATIACVTYGDRSVSLGNELKPRQVKDEPEITWKAEEGSLYTLLMVDPDAPSRETPTYREILHWFVINIPGNKLSEGQVVAEYIGSGPPEGSGLHRYVFLVFKQTQTISTDTFISKNSREGRLSIKTRDYIVSYKLGDLVAGNYYQAQYDDYVPILKAQLN